MKKTHHHLVFLFLCVTLFAGFSFAQKRAITEKDLFQFRWIGDPQLSPDGTQVAFVRIAVDDKREDYETSIWSVSMNGGGLRRLTADKHDTSPQWSPNGKFLAFVRTLEKDGKPQPPQIFILPMEGGEGWQLTHLPKGASGPVWSPDGKTLAFSSSTNAEDLAKAACDEGKEKEKDKEKDKEKSKCTKPGHEPDIHVVTRAEYRVNGQGYIDFSRQDHIWSIAFPSGAQDLPQPKQLTSGDFDEAEIEWAPDSSKIYFTSDRELEPYYGLGQNVIYSVPAAGGESSEVARIAGSAQSISVSKDGSRLAFLGVLNTPIQSHTKTNLWVVDLKAGATPRSLSTKYDWDIGGGILGDQEPPRGGGGIQPVWSADGKWLTILVAKQGHANLERFDAESGEVTPLTKGDQAVTGYSSNGSQIVAEISTPTMINDLFAVGPDGAQKRLTDINEKLFSELNLTPPEEILYQSFDGRKIQTWVQKPPNFNPNKKYPLILNIHGGPHAAYGYVFFHEMQYMAARGYVVLYPNPRGSTSYDEAFGNIIQYHYPGDDFKDLMAGVDELIRRGYVDEKHMGVTGGSGGGLLTDWTVTHTDRFAGAVSQRDIADWAAWWYSADFTLFQPRWFHKPPFEDPQDYRDRSPITYINNVKTPLMLILGDADFRTPPDSGGGTMFRALKFRKIPTAMVRFPGESHELSRSGKPWHRIERLHHIVNWFDIYLQGKKTNEYDLVPPPEPDWEKTDTP
ncbi:MAG TPA: S9 family peptidase [Terriglobales bacterium]|nr:S9 family peptidase [Terriglobales bacterium]